MTETWLDVSYRDFALHVKSYNVSRKDRYNKRGGGVIIAVHISCIQRRDLKVEAEILAFKICPNLTDCVLFAGFYRPPNGDESILKWIISNPESVTLILDDFFLQQKTLHPSRISGH